MSSLAKTRVLVMHGENLIDAGLAFTLSRHADIEVLEPCMAEGVNAVLNWLYAQRADILITDYDRGVSLATALNRTELASRPSRPRLMVVTNRATRAEIRHALKHGVAGYLTNTSPADEVVHAVRNVQMGIRHVSEPLARSLLDDLLDEQLTPRESEVLRLAAQGLSNKVIAGRLRVELGTVKCHMCAILDKLRAGNRTEAVVIAQQQGLLALAPSSFPARAPASSHFQLRPFVSERQPLAA
jgi:DNA-binding NarL/FixJ family response regulator